MYESLPPVERLACGGLVRHFDGAVRPSQPHLLAEAAVAERSISNYEREMPEALSLCLRDSISIG